jgi:hypothetical protein
MVSYYKTTQCHNSEYLDLNPQAMFFALGEKLVSYPYKTTGKVAQLFRLYIGDRSSDILK